MWAVGSKEFAVETLASVLHDASTQHWRLGCFLERQASELLVGKRLT
jgi:hypothetical protein